MEERHFVRDVKSESGQALLEFACVSIILILLFGGVIDGVRVIRYHILMSGAATDMVSKISADSARNIGTTDPEVNATCQSILDNNFQRELGDGRTSYYAYKEALADDTWDSFYHLESGETWSGKRKYVLQRVDLKREVELLTPLGALIFGDGSGVNYRTMTSSAAVRIYMN